MGRLKFSGQSIRQAMARPSRKPPQLLKLPHYEQSVALFQKLAPAIPLISFELERRHATEQDFWMMACYCGDRSVRGMVVNHADTASIRARLGDFYARWRTRFDPAIWAPTGAP